jgi:hypothetical protein
VFCNQESSQLLQPQPPFGPDFVPPWWARKIFDSGGRHPYTAASDSNIAHKKVTRKRNSESVRQPRGFARVLSFLLLGFIVYGTTVEAAHTHGNLEAANNALGAASFSDPATQTKATTNLTGCGDCLICQLHQHFSTTLISASPTIVPTALRSRIFNLTAVSVHSQTAMPLTGRAPPQASCK